ncbi:lysylphosphatidylglycerol synthase domain-containing protein [Pusillimonas sp. ANT_WB101]|uniref:lysylphosphatidylglycerol synthase domain-containing protein n=1 Tax=Pusillimonas sp. ANT_WB101 TaxID=2597356 RepID=UPI0011ED74FA|nr:lysylphosphatidylglycerol synthase domain-containing protein [Pusillimonas sp. ANT_WB101]KAA0910964.1 UPF0104 family protein [Pusillimonas sp. ANT_WB101]
MKSSWVSSCINWGKANWSRLRTVLTTVFLILIVLLIGMAAWKVEWSEVLKAMAQVPLRALALGGVLTLASYFVYATFDLIGKRYVGHKLSSLRTYLSGMMVYAFIMSLGSSVGGLGLRLRLYTQQGVSPGKATRVFGLAVVTNWIGYLLLAGVVFALGAIDLPADWWLGTGTLRIIGAIMAVVALAYVLLCFFSGTRSWSVRGQQVELPSGVLSLLQVFVATCNWALMGSVLWVLLQQRVAYPVVLGAILLSAVAGLIARVPAGLGVLEAVVIALLTSPDMSRSEVLAGALVYRAVYYLAPLFIAGVIYLLTEMTQRNRASAFQAPNVKARS